MCYRGRGNRCKDETKILRSSPLTEKCVESSVVRMRTDVRYRGRGNRCKNERQRFYVPLQLQKNAYLLNSEMNVKEDGKFVFSIKENG